MRNSREKWGKPRVNRDALEIGGKWIWLLRWLRLHRCNSVVTSDYDDYEYWRFDRNFSKLLKKIKIIKKISVYESLRQKKTEIVIQEEIQTERKTQLTQDLFVSLAWKTFYSFIIRTTTIDTETMQTGHFLLR